MEIKKEITSEMLQKYDFKCSKLYACCTHVQCVLWHNEEKLIKVCGKYQLNLIFIRVLKVINNYF